MNKTSIVRGRSMLFALSLVCNLLVVVYFGRQYYYRHRVALINKISYAYDRQTIYDLLPVNDSDIVFAGDSHVQFFDVNEFFPGVPIKNRGIIEDNTLGLLNRAHQFVVGHPKQILLEIGVNDLWDNISADTIIRHVESIVRLIKKQSPQSIILINSLFPSSAKRGKDIKGLIPAINKQLQKLCEQEKIKFIDCYSQFSLDGALDPRFDCGDGIHLNGNGYKVWSEILIRNI